MKRLLSLCLTFAFAVALAACDKQEQAPPGETAEAVGGKPSAEGGTDGSPAAEGAAVEVAADGTKFDPPVAPAQLPAGAWYCDMGTAHYAAMEKGEGKCPICGMALTQKE